MRPTLWTFAVLLVASGARAQTPTKDEVDWKVMPPPGPERPFQPPRATRLALEGGGVLLVVPNTALPLATVLFAMPGAGSTSDPADRAGLAAFTADLLDEGAGGLQARELAERVEALGSELATWAEEDAAFVRIASLTRNLPASLELVGKVLTAPAFEDDDGKRIHEDQTASVRLRRDRPGAVAQVVFEAGLYGAAAPYGHPAFGYLSDLGRFGVADARTFYQKQFARERLLVVVAGDVTPDTAKQQVEAALAGWKAAGEPVAAPAAVEKIASKSRLLVIDRPGAEQANVVIGTLGMTRVDDRSYALDVLTNVLGGTFTSRLNNRLREQLGYTYGATAYPTFHRQTGAVVISTALSTPKTALGMKEILTIVADIAKTPLSATELAAAQQNLIRGLPDYFRTNDDIADAFAGTALIGLPEDWFQGYADRVRGVTAAQVSAVAGSLLEPKRLIAVVVGPLDQIERDVSKVGFGKPTRFDPDGAPQAGRRK
jgi:zinc protease